MLKLCAVSLLLILISLDFGNATDAVDNNCFLVSKKICVVKTLNVELLSQEKVLHDSVRLHYMTVLEFKEILGKYESNCNYAVTNQFGFKGKYQFSDYLINKIAGVTPEQFLNSPEIQEETMTLIIDLYIDYLSNANYIKYINTKIGNNLITLESLLLGCHFSPTYLSYYINSNGRINKDDGYITIGDYMKRFENTHKELTVLVRQCK
jgi:hypothetical protein